jgi:hypothetical protein
MDPFSITAGSIGITGFATASFGQLHTIISGFAEAHEEVRDIKSSLENIQHPLSALTQIPATQQAITCAARDDLKRAGLAEAVNSCGDACAKFSKDLERWTKHSAANRMSFRDRFLVGVWHKEKIRTLRTQLQSCSETLQLAVSSTQLYALYAPSRKAIRTDDDSVIQLRSEGLSEVDRESTRRSLQAVEDKLQEHLLLSKDQQTDARTRIQELEEEHDGSADFDQAIEEATKRVQVLEADQVSCGVVFAQAESMRSGIDIGKVLTSQKSTAYVGMPPSVVGKVNLRIGEVTTQDGATSHVGVFGNVDFGVDLGSMGTKGIRVVRGDGGTSMGNEDDEMR